MKGIGIITVIYGHMFAYKSTISNIIFSFHMPLFFFVSGMFFKPQNAVKFMPYLKKKCKQILLPYLLFCIIGAIVTLLFIKKFTVKDLIPDIYLGSPDHITMTLLWFLMCLFDTEIFFFFIYKFVINRNNIVLTTVILLTLAYFANFAKEVIDPHLPFGRMPLKMDSAIMATVFYSLGYLMNEALSSKDFLKKNILLLPLCAVLTLFCSNSNGWVNIAMAQYNNLFYYLFFAVIGIILTAFIAKILDIGFLRYIGRNSLIIFAFHSLIQRLYVKIVIIMGKWQGTNIQIIIGGIFILLTMMLIACICNTIKSIIKRRFMVNRC